MDRAILSGMQKLVLAGQQAGFTIDQMIDLLNAGLTVETLLDLIELRLSSTPSTSSSSRWVI
jgi:hypothetical protein